MLFLRDPEIQLFSFAVDAAPMPPPPAVGLLIPSVAPLTPATGALWPPPPVGGDRRRDRMNRAAQARAVKNVRSASVRAQLAAVDHDAFASANRPRRWSTCARAAWAYG